MQIRTICLIVAALSGFIPVALMQHRDMRKKIQNETRIKLPPSDIAFTHESTTGDIEGEVCFNLVRRTNGICTLPNQCPEAIRDFQHKGIQPQICNYKGHVPIICCPEKPVLKPVIASSNIPSTTRRFVSQPSSSTATTISLPPPPPPSTPTPSVVSPNIGIRISEKKCKQYMKLMIEESVVTTLSLNPENRTVQKTKCAKSSGEGFIVGGTKTENGEFPHMAAIGWQQEKTSPIEWNCGGSLIR